jgi:hypothetical protein
MTKIGKKELEDFQEFENKILSLKGERVKYKKDGEIEGQIKRDVLYENFGEIPTDDLLRRLRLSFSDLSNQETYIEIYNFLEQDKKK